MCRKIFGSMILLFLGIPSLIGTIWLTGVVRAVTSPEFFSDLPKEIIKEVPDLVDGFVEAAQDPEFTDDKNMQTWIKAIAEADTTPKELLQKLGIFDWMEGELTETFDEVGQVARGESTSTSVVLDLTQIKTGLESDTFDQYLVEVLNNLPACTDEQMQAWMSLESETTNMETAIQSLPACKPSQIDPSFLSAMIREQVINVPDEIDLFQESDIVPADFANLLSMANTIVYFLFIIPAVLILLGSLIADSSMKGLLRWSGISTLIGGGIPLLSAFLMRNSLSRSWSFDSSMWSSAEYSTTQPTLSPEVQSLIAEKTAKIMSIVLGQLFAPVITVAVIVCVIGLVLLVLSFLFSLLGRKKKEAAPQVAPAAPQAGAAPVQPVSTDQPPAAPEKTPITGEPTQAPVASQPTEAPVVDQPGQVEPPTEVQPSVETKTPIVAGAPEIPTETEEVEPEEEKPVRITLPKKKKTLKKAKKKARKKSKKK